MKKATKSTAKKSVRHDRRTFDEVIFTHEEALACANKWKNILGLRDWYVLLTVRRGEDMFKPNIQGQVQGVRDKQVILLSLLDPVDYGADNIAPQNMEKTIIHELLHVLFYPLKIKEKLSLEEEIIVDKLSSALYGVINNHFDFEFSNFILPIAS